MFKQFRMIENKVVEQLKKEIRNAEIVNKIKEEYRKKRDEHNKRDRK